MKDGKTGKAIWQHVADHLASQGVRAIPGQIHTTAELQGRRWIIRPAIPTTVQVPQSARIRTRTDGTLSLRFSGYAIARPEEEIITIDEESVNMMYEADSEEMYESDLEEISEELQVLQYLASLNKEQKSQDNKNQNPIWDEYPEETEETDDFINPFAKHGGEQEHIFKSEAAYAVDGQLDYPILRKLAKKVESAFSTAESSLTRPREIVMGPPLYPPSTRKPPQLNIPKIQARAENFRGGYARQHDGIFNLPTAQTGQGVMLVLPYDIGQYADVISRWESITLNFLNEKDWSDNKAK